MAARSADVAQQARLSRRLRNLVEPIAATIFFSAEAQLAFTELGFLQPNPDHGAFTPPDPDAYILSRSACLGEVPAAVVTAAFAIFPHRVIAAALDRWRPRVGTSELQRVRCDAAVTVVGRQVGPVSSELQRAARLVRRMSDALPVEGRTVFAGLQSIGYRDEPIFDLWHGADLYREHRGDSHVAAWSSRGLTPPQACLVNDLAQGLPLKSYVRTRGWSESELDEAIEDLRSRGLLAGTELSPRGHELRDLIEAATDTQQLPAVRALGDDIEELCALLEPCRDAILDQGGYPDRAAISQAQHWQEAKEGGVG